MGDRGFITIRCHSMCPHHKVQSACAAQKNVQSRSIVDTLQRTSPYGRGLDKGTGWPLGQNLFITSGKNTDEAWASKDRQGFLTFNFKRFISWSIVRQHQQGGDSSHPLLLVVPITQCLPHSRYGLRRHSTVPRAKFAPRHHSHLELFG